MFSGLAYTSEIKHRTHYVIVMGWVQSMLGSSFFSLFGWLGSVGHVESTAYLHISNNNNNNSVSDSNGKYIYTLIPLNRFIFRHHGNQI